MTESPARELLILDLAETQAERAEAWWRRHREKAPELFAFEFRHACSMIVEVPSAGTLVRLDRSGAMVRRYLMSSTRYHVYYTFTDRVVTLLAVWSAVKKRGPRLPR